MPEKPAEDNTKMVGSALSLSTRPVPVFAHDCASSHGGRLPQSVLGLHLGIMRLGETTAQFQIVNIDCRSANEVYVPTAQQEMPLMTLERRHLLNFAAA